MTDMKLSVDALDFVFEDDLKVKLKVEFEFNVKLSLKLSSELSSDLGFSFFFFLVILNFFFLCEYLFQHMSSL